MESPQAHGFVEEIDPQELYFHEVVGKGAFGVVSRAKWRGKDVAVKLIETESERKAFFTELKQLSRVYHPNIVKLYGACRHAPAVCLVMEYAEGGSLYNVLHQAGPQPVYNAAHAMSWALQCARGVEYLHCMKPKALIHRDLKPPNLLLIMGGTVLKICDFGTACDIQTHMTNNKGSAAWMAPEVFEGSNYSEKCDVFSWGIIIWEVFTRRKPFDEIGGPAFRIMWAVHNGTRPPLIQNLPKPLELLMTRCWSGKPAERPSMAEVVRIMTHMFQFFSGADEPLLYPAYIDESPDYTFSSPMPTGSGFSGPPSNVSTNNMPTGDQSRSSTFSETVRHSGDYIPPLPHTPTTPQRQAPVVTEDDTRGQKSAPPSLAASRESLIGIHSPRSGTPVDHQKRYSADLTNLQEYDLSSQGVHGGGVPQKVLGHRRSGSHGNPIIMRSGVMPQRLPMMHHTGRGHRRIGSDGYSDLQLITNSPMVLPPSTISIQQSPPATIHHVSTYPSMLNHSSRETTPTPQNMGSLSVGASRENTPPFRSVSYNQATVSEGNKPTVRSSSWTSDIPVMPPLSVNVNVGPAMGTTPLIGATGSQQYVGGASHFGGGVSNQIANQLTNPLTNQAMSLVYQSLDHQYQPIAPCPTSQESMEIFQRHCQLAQQYLRYQTEIAMFEQTRHELMKELGDEVMDQQSTTQLQQEYEEQTRENESLKSFHNNLTMQLEQIRKKQQQNRVGAS